MKKSERMIDAQTKRGLYDVKYVSSPVDVLCFAVVVVARVRDLVARVSAARVFRPVAKTHVLAFAPSNRD